MGGLVHRDRESAAAVRSWPGAAQHPPQHDGSRSSTPAGTTLRYTAFPRRPDPCPGPSGHRSGTASAGCDCPRLSDQGHPGAGAGRPRALHRPGLHPRLPPRPYARRPAGLNKVFTPSPPVADLYAQFGRDTRAVLRLDGSASTPLRHVLDARCRRGPRRLPLECGGPFKISVTCPAIVRRADPPSGHAPTQPSRPREPAAKFLRRKLLGDGLAWEIGIFITLHAIRTHRQSVGSAVLSDVLPSRHSWRPLHAQGRGGRRRPDQSRGLAMPAERSPAWNGTP
jgi:hypothetical protein